MSSISACLMLFFVTCFLNSYSPLIEVIGWKDRRCLRSQGSLMWKQWLGDVLIVSLWCVHRVITSSSCALVQTAPWLFGYRSLELAEYSAIGATRCSGKSECGHWASLGFCLVLRSTTAIAVGEGGSEKDRVCEPNPAALLQVGQVYTQHLTFHRMFHHAQSRNKSGIDSQKMCYGFYYETHGTEMCLCGFVFACTDNRVLLCLKATTFSVWIFLHLGLCRLIL